VEPFREAAVAVPPTTPPGSGVDRGAAALRGVLPVRDPLEGLSLETERLGLEEDDDGDDDDGPDLEPEPSAPPDPTEPPPPELDPPEEVEPPDELDPAVVRGTAWADSPTGAASARARADVNASRVERVMALTPQAARAAHY
jgi:hypothetical protein